MLKRILGKLRKKPEVTLPVEPEMDKIRPKVGAGRKLTPTEWRTRGMRAKKGPLPAPKPAPKIHIQRDVSRLRLPEGYIPGVSKGEASKSAPPTRIYRKRR